MPKRPVRDATPLDNYERPLVRDLIEAMQRTLARHERLVFHPVKQTWLLPDGRTVEKRLGYRSLAGDEVTPEEYKRTGRQRRLELRELERELVPLAEFARKRSPKLFERFRPDVDPRGPLAPGAFAAKGWIENRDNLCESVSVWADRLRGASRRLLVERRNKTAKAIRKYISKCAGEIRTALRELQEKHNAFQRPLPDKKEITHAFALEKQTGRGARLSIAEALHGLLTGAPDRKWKAFSPKTFQRAVSRAVRGAGGSPTLLRERLNDMLDEAEPPRDKQAIAERIGPARSPVRDK